MKAERGTLWTRLNLEVLREIVSAPFWLLVPRLIALFYRGVGSFQPEAVRP